MRQLTEPLFHKIDCVRLPVPDLEVGLAFYRDRLGHQLIWRRPTSAGLRLPKTDAELVLYTDGAGEEIDLVVASADDAAAAIARAGGRVVDGPFDIPIGRCALVEDPFGNRLVVLDGSKGVLLTDANGTVMTDAAGAPRLQPRG